MEQEPSLKDIDDYQKSTSPSKKRDIALTMGAVFLVAVAVMATLTFFM